MLEIMGEVVYKAVAYRRVADAVERYPRTSPRSSPRRRRRSCRAPEPR